MSKRWTDLSDDEFEQVLGNLSSATALHFENGRLPSTRME